MSLNPDVQKAWEKWKDTPLPVDNFRLANGRALTYGIECDLDHHASHLASLIEELDANNPHWDFGARARTDLAELNELQERIEALELDQNVAEPFVIYMAATRNLLRAIGKNVLRPK